MANHINMVAHESILQLHKRGYSNRRIARELGLNHETVSRYIRLGAVDPHIDLPGAAGSNQAKVPIGITGAAGPNQAKVPAGITDASDSNQAKVPAEISRSLCAPYHAHIIDGIERGLTAQRIYQDLCSECDFIASYDSVKRYVRRFSDTKSCLLARPHGAMTPCPPSTG